MRASSACSPSVCLRMTCSRSSWKKRAERERQTTSRALPRQRRSFGSACLCLATACIARRSAMLLIPRDDTQTVSHMQQPGRPESTLRLPPHRCPAQSDRARQPQACQAIVAQASAPGASCGAKTSAPRAPSKAPGSLSWSYLGLRFCRRRVGGWAKAVRFDGDGRVHTRRAGAGCGALDVGGAGDRRVDGAGCPAWERQVIFAVTMVRSSWQQPCSCGWLEYGVETLYIDPGKPWQNGKEERFNGTVRDECLNLHVFGSLAEAHVRLSAFRAAVQFTASA